ncbi:MAG: hypothetical protein WC881_04925 [Elusimicrobiota bacterium]|jgi:tetratricopeptide (TPR) repeat protein
MRWLWLPLLLLANAAGAQERKTADALALSGSEAVRSDLLSAQAGGGIQDGPTSFDKLSEAQSWLSQGKPAEAALAARRAIELQPRNRRAYDALATAYRLLRDYKQALYAADLGLKAFPNDAELLKTKLFALNKQKDFSAALAAAEQGLSVNATDALLYVFKAYAQGGSGDTDGMLASLQTAAALDPNLEGVLLQARRDGSGEPFIMPGDIPPQARPQPGRFSARAPGKRVLVVSGLLLCLLALFVLLALSGGKKGPRSPEDFS